MARPGWDACSAPFAARETVVARTATLMRYVWRVQWSALCRGRRSEPGGQRVGEPRVGEVSYPGDVSVGPDQHGRRSGDLSQHGELPHPDILSVDQLHSSRPRRDVEPAGLTEVQQ